MKLNSTGRHKRPVSFNQGVGGSNFPAGRNHTNVQIVHDYTVACNVTSRSQNVTMLGAFWLGWNSLRIATGQMARKENNQIRQVAASRQHSGCRLRFELSTL